MKERILGKTKLKVKTLGFGGIPIQRVSEDEAIQVVKKCYDLGLNYYDTARGYTTSEERIGKALEEVRENVFLATKSHAQTPEALLKEIEISLNNLRTDYIDVFQLHNIATDEVWENAKKPGGILDTIQDVKDDGLINHISVTSHSPDLSIEMVKSGFFETLMIPYNYLTPKPAEKLLPLCQKLGVGTIIMKPFGGGAFNNAKTALKYVFSDPNVDLVIPGMMSVKEVEENYAVWIGDHAITKEEEALIKRDIEDLGNEFCRACGYCQPCPQEIPISFILRAEKQMLRRMGWSERRVKSVKTAKEKVESCIQCGECESRCPYHLPIIELLPKVMDSLWTHMENQTIP